MNLSNRGKIEALALNKIETQTLKHLQKIGQSSKERIDLLPRNPRLKLSQ